MADTRYLKKQGHAWSFCMTVPQELRTAFPSDGRRAPGGRRLAGKPREKIVIALDTQSLSEAQERRWPLVHEWREKFKRAKAKVPITITEIEDAAREQYTYLLERMAADAERGKYNGPPVHGPDGVTVMFTPEEAAIDAALDAAGTALEEEAWEEAEAEVKRIERQKGVAIERGSPTHGLLAKAILTAQLEAFDGRQRLLSGKTSEPPVTFLGSAGIDPVTLRPIASLPRPVTRIRTSDGITFEEAAARYLDELRSSSITAQTLLRTERVFSLFKSYAGNPPLAAIDKDTAHDFITKVASLDPSWGNRERPDKMTFTKLIETFGQGKRHLWYPNTFSRSISFFPNQAVLRFQLLDT